MLDRKKNYVSFSSDGFVNFRSHQFDRLLQELTDTSSQDFFLRKLKATPYKLHITLNPKDYLTHRKAIRNILLKYLQENVIFSFKYMETRVSDKRLKDFAAELQRLAESFVGAEPAEVAQRRMEVERKIMEEEQYRAGGQFTIYVINSNIERLAACCKEVDDYLHSKMAIHGKHTDVESELTRYWYFRQEYFFTDFLRMTENGHLQDIRLRINRVKIVDTAEEVDRRLRILGEQTKSEFYQQLHRALNPEVGLRLKV